MNADASFRKSSTVPPRWRQMISDPVIVTLSASIVLLTLLFALAPQGDPEILKVFRLTYAEAQDLSAQLDTMFSDSVMAVKVMEAFEVIGMHVSVDPGVLKDEAYLRDVVRLQAFSSNFYLPYDNDLAWIDTLLREAQTRFFDLVAVHERIAVSGP